MIPHLYKRAMMGNTATWIFVHGCVDGLFIILSFYHSNSERDLQYLLFVLTELSPV